MSFFTVPFRGKTFHVTTVGSATPIYVQQSFLQLEKEMREEWWDIQVGQYVVDVGAAYGSYTLPALALGAEKVVFFEPSKTEFFDVCSNLLINGWLDKCIPLNCLAGDESGVRNDYYQDSHSYRPEGQKDSRVVLTVDKVVEAYHLSRVDWLKIDTEGAEPQVLKGALKTIEAYRPKILVENHVGFIPGVDILVREILEPLGYKVEKSHRGEGKNDFWQLYTY